MDKLPEEALFILFSYLPTFRDLVRCSMVCKKWRTVLDSESSLWEEALDREVPECFITDKLIQHLESAKSKLKAYLCAWSDIDRSENIEINPNRLTLHRQPVAQSTDAIRGKRGFSHGQHYWTIIWHGPSFGSNAVVGVATKECPLHGEGYYSLLGSDCDSWGWDLSKKRLQHCGEKLADYPRVGSGEVSRMAQTVDLSPYCIVFIPQTTLVQLAITFLQSSRKLTTGVSILHGRWPNDMRCYFIGTVTAEDWSSPGYDT